MLCTLVKTARPILQNHVINLHAESRRTVTELILLPNLCPYLFSVPAAHGGNSSSQLKAESLAEIRRHSSNQSVFRKKWQSCWEKTVQQFKGSLTELQAVSCLETVSWVDFSTQTNKDPAEEGKWRSSEKVSKQRPLRLHSLHLLCQGCGSKREGQVSGSRKGFPSSTEIWLRHEKRQEGTSSFTETFANSSQGDPASSSSQFFAGGQRIKVGLKQQQTAGRKALLSVNFQMLVQDVLSPHGGRIGWRSNVLKGEKWVLLQAELFRESSPPGNLLIIKLKINLSYLLALVYLVIFFLTPGWVSQRKQCLMPLFT